VLAVGGVDLCVGPQRVLDRAERLAGGEKEAGGDDLAPALPNFRDGPADGRQSELPGAFFAPFEKVLRPGEADLFGRVVGLSRSRDGRVRDLYPASQEQFGRDGAAGDGDQGRPPRVRTKAEGCRRDRGRKSLMPRNSRTAAVL
jgi:hypothetical protein